MTNSTDVTQALALLEIDLKSTFTKTVTETDVVLFAGITGDFHPVHMDQELMAKTPYGTRLVHGLFVLGLMSTAGAKLTEKLSIPTVSVGYTEVKFVQPVLIGDTITATYRIKEHAPKHSRVFSEVTGTNQRGDVVAHAIHELKVG